VESPLPRDRYGGFGERPGETDRWQHRNRAPGRLNKRRPPWHDLAMCRTAVCSVGNSLVSVVPVVSVQPARTVSSSMMVRVPSIPARTRAGRQTRARNRVRRSGLPTVLA
jgi:hypothetical protein